MLLLVFAPLAIAKLEILFGFNLSAEADATWNNTILTLTGVAMFIVVANLYFVLPNIKQSLIKVVPGAAIVVLLWIAAASLFSLYLSNFDQVNLIYGSLGGIIATLIFFYIINLIFIFGAEFNYHLANARGEVIEEKEHSDEE
jgi:membrane protein